MSEHIHRARVDIPDELSVRVTQRIDAPVDVVYRVLTEEEFLRRTLVPFDETLKDFSFDVRVGGDYRYSFVPLDGAECVFRGRYLELDPPRRTVATWVFEGWEGVEAVETFDVVSVGDGTDLSWTLRFADQEGRSHIRGTDGIESNLVQIADVAHELWESREQRAERGPEGVLDSEV